jgi:cell division protein FtsI (penicillin-binding protein 3)/stage V sporulation protein D (sporulation-specific penicillin-binding protein)
VANATHITNLDELVPLLAESLALPAAELTQKLSSNRRYIVLKRELPQPAAVELRQKLREKKLRGISFEPDSTRVYPNGSMLCHVLGFTNFDRNGIQGIESSMEQYLHGQDGFRFIEHNRAGQEIVTYRGVERPPRDGFQVQLTVDLNLQHIVEQEIDAAVLEYRPEKAIIILMRPDGEILAMANRPHFDLNKRSEAKPEQMKNRAILDIMEPGSTFKIVTTAAVLNERKARPETVVHCENGLWHYGGRSLRDVHGYGALSVRDVLVKSSNIGSAKLAMMLGEQKFYEYIRRFGFGERSGIELPAEEPGTVHAPQRWSKISITRIPMGHEVAVTALQMTTAMAVIANGGKLVTPRIVKSITDPDGKPITTSSPTELRQVVSPEVAALVSSALAGVVTDGTAKLAAVPNFTVAGKTGTAQKVSPRGGYEPGKYVVSFSGYMPADRPAIVGIVVLDDAKPGTVSNYGGTIAAPIFARVAERAAGYLDLERHEEPRKAVPVGKVALTTATKTSRR